MNRLFLLMILAVFQGCTAKEFSTEEYIQWVESPDNGLKVEKTIDEFKFTLQYKPANYMVAKEKKKTNNNVSINDYSGMQQFNLKIEVPGHSTEMLQVGISSQEEYFSRIEYYTGPAQDDIKLIDGQDTLNCILYHFERSYNMAPYNNIVLGFPVSKTKDQDNKILSYNDQVLGVGIMNLLIDKKDLKKLSEIKIK